MYYKIRSDKSLEEAMEGTWCFFIPGNLNWIYKKVLIRYLEPCQKEK